MSCWRRIFHNLEDNKSIKHKANYLFIINKSIKYIFIKGALLESSSKVASNEVNCIALIFHLLLLLENRGDGITATGLFRAASVSAGLGLLGSVLSNLGCREKIQGMLKT